MRPEEVRHFAFHPGGKKIVLAIEGLLAPFGGRIDAAREVLRTRGNLSSATVLYVLEECLRAGVAPGDWLYLLAFGPGFTATNVLLRA